MSFQRHDTRTRAPQKYGKPSVTYPYGDPRWPRIVEMRTSKKGPDNSLLAPLSPHRDQQSYPGALLTDQQSDQGDDTDKNVTETYEVLPGPVFIDIVPDPELGIPVGTTTERRASTDVFTVGEIAPIAFGIAGATIAAETVVSLNAPHDFIVGEYVVGAGTSHTTPTLNGQWQVVAIPSPTSVTLALDVTGISGAIGGTLKRYSYMFVERHKTDNVNVVERVTTRAMTNDITQYTANNTTLCARPYPFPDALIEVFGYSSDTDGSTTETTTWGFSYSFSGGVAFRILNGFRGDCVAKRIRVFSMGPITTMPTDPQTSQPYTPTVVIPASGTVTVEGGASSITVTTTGMTLSNSDTWKGERIPPVLTAAFSGSVTQVGSGFARFSVDLPNSIIKDPGSAARAGFVQGDIITMIDPPEKMRAIGVYMLTIWKIVVPYTTGVGPS